MRIYIDKCDLEDMVEGSEDLCMWSPEKSIRFCTPFVPSTVVYDLVGTLEFLSRKAEELPDGLGYQIMGWADDAIDEADKCVRSLMD